MINFWESNCHNFLVSKHDDEEKTGTGMRNTYQTYHINTRQNTDEN